MSKILVTGATGGFGKGVIQTLINKGIDKDNIIAFVRSGEKAQDFEKIGIEARIGDYADYNSLVKAFDGIEKLLLVSSNDVPNREQQHENAVRAAKEAGVKHIVYTGVLHKRTEELPEGFMYTSKSHFFTQQLIRENGFDYTFLENNIYLDLLPHFVGPNVLETGIYLPAGNGEIGFALRSEMAEVAANILISNGHENKSYDISGKSASFQQIADWITEITGKKVGYESPDLQTYADSLKQAGMPDSVAIIFGGFADAAKEGQLSSDGVQMEQLLGRKPTSIKDFIKQVYGKQPR